VGYLFKRIRGEGRHTSFLILNDTYDCFNGLPDPFSFTGCKKMREQGDSQLNVVPGQSPKVSISSSLINDHYGYPGDYTIFPSL
jgi:hypothetical protein